MSKCTESKAGFGFFVARDGFYPSNVLNLTIAMKRFFSVLTLLLLFFPRSVQAQGGSDLNITSPQEGQIVQGLVSVKGSATLTGFSSYELAFAYSDDPTNTWFILQNSSLSVFEGELGTWDTTTLTDGNYTLRLRAFLLDGTTKDVMVASLRVRNYTAVPTSTFTPTATAFAPLLVPTAQLIAPMPATVTPSLPTPTSLPANPASLAVPSISGALARGAFLALLLFLGFGLILRLRHS